MKNLTVNAAARTIEMTSKKFATAAAKFGTDEYKALQEVRRDYPGFKVAVVVARKAPKPRLYIYIKEPSQDKPCDGSFI